MAHNNRLPCDGDGICMVCKSKPSTEDTLTCKTCVTPWHATCLCSRPETLASILEWECPDCSPISDTTNESVQSAVSTASGDLIAAIRAIEADGSLTEQEKAKKRQELMSGSGGSKETDDESKNKDGDNEVLDMLDGNLNCSFCMQLPERPVTTPCGHNFCLKCFQKWIGQGKRTCAKCRNTIPPKMASQPRINPALVVAIRMARLSKSTSSKGPIKVHHFVHNQNRPDKAFTTERAKKTGKANACSGKIFVTIPPDHFGPILAENDPDRTRGVLVGDSWEDRMECRQWGAHFPHVAGIAGQSDYGAQSVALSGGYADDEDHGEWFLYTGSGGRDLSGNKRTNKDQSFDQKFDKSNEALRVSCKKGYPVRVVRSHKEKRSSYAPETGVRYDGVYRIEKCWRKTGIQGFKVCRYLFVRCDNEPAPWTSDAHGDRPRALPVVKELKNVTGITERKESPSWDYDEQESCWKWKKPPPTSRKPADNGDLEERKRARRVARQEKNLSVREKLLKEFCCLLCRKVMTLPLTTPCAHNFCKPCLQGAFEGQTFVREITCESRTLRTRKNTMKCPSCPNDISDFLQNPQVNTELMDIIESLQRKTEENVEDAEEIVDDMEEHAEETSEESSGTVNPEALVGDAEVGIRNFELLEAESKLKQALKQKDIDGEKTSKSPLNKPDGGKEGKTEVLDSEMPKTEEVSKVPVIECTPKRTNKRKKSSDASESETPKRDTKGILSPAIERTPEQTPKRKKVIHDDCGSPSGGVRTRSMKSKELGNDSPSGLEKSQEKQKNKRKKVNDEACLSELGEKKTRSQTKGMK